MATSAQIKKDLISRINESKDLVFLKALKVILDTAEQDSYQLSTEQEAAISIGREQINKGEFSSNESVFSEMKEWLSKK